MNCLSKVGSYYEIQLIEFNPLSSLLKIHHSLKHQRTTTIFSIQVHGLQLNALLEGFIYARIFFGRDYVDMLMQTSWYVKGPCICIIFLWTIEMNMMLITSLNGWVLIMIAMIMGILLKLFVMTVLYLLVSLQVLKKD